VPLAEIAPGWRHPVTGEGVRDMLARLPDRDVPRKLP
jgi:2-amino-4-hydroxy-6-hydroxymethyldihydropteridine diphosphokinase